YARTYNRGKRLPCYFDALLLSAADFDELSPSAGPGAETLLHEDGLEGAGPVSACCRRRAGVSAVRSICHCPGITELGWDCLRPASAVARCKHSRMRRS